MVALFGGAWVDWVVVGRWKVLTEELKEREHAILGGFFWGRRFLSLGRKWS